jgi:PAS domain S-box-containing protein
LLYARRLIEASLDPLVTISPEGRITDVNQATEMVTGMSRQGLIGSDFSSYFTDPAKAGAGYQKVLAEGSVRDYPLTIRHTSGTTTDVLYHATVYRNEAGEVQGVFAAARDITERKRSEAQLQTLHQALERRAAQLQTLASELTLTEQRARRRLSQHLHDHLQQLLYAARLSVTTLRRRVGETDLLTLIHNVDHLLGQCIDECRSLTVELSPAILYDAGLAAALEWLARQMLQNYGLAVNVFAEGEVEPEAEDIKVLLFYAVRELLFNVVKHAGAKKAWVKLRRMANQKIGIEVLDDGVGIQKADCQGAELPGTGFGLFSIRERLELMGGRLEVHSAPGKGTRVTIISPSQQPQSSTPCPAAAPASPAGVTADSLDRGESEKMLAKIRVLIADDHAVFRKGLLGVLQQESDIHVVAEAGDGEAAVAEANNHRPDVVLMDLAMPKVDGMEATRRITAAMQGVRVIGLSAHQEEDMADALTKAGAVAYLSKDQPVEHLIATIRNVAGRPASDG